MNQGQLPTPFYCALLVLPLTLLFSCSGSNSSQGTLPSGSRQMLLVITDDWSATRGEMRRYQRASDGRAWEPVGGVLPVVVGRSGLGWGSGLHSPHLAGPQKREGDGRAPAGIFTLPSAFGYAEPSNAPRTALPYLQLTSAIECVDDTASIYYNAIVDNARVGKPDWSSSEKMSQTGEFYRWGITVDHNIEPTTRGGGSCIFIHVWGGLSVATSGCTALESNNVVELIKWLVPSQSPLLVQLPREEYDRLRESWNLPLVR